jgi:hypothetical protein
VLEVRAPARPGRYVLFVGARGHGDRMTVEVRRPPKLPAVQAAP